MANFQIDHDSLVAFEIYGTRFETKISIACILLLIFLISLFIFVKIFYNFFNIPHLLRDYFKNKQKSSSIESLFQSVIAMSLGNDSDAAKHLKNIRGYDGLEKRHLMLIDYKISSLLGDKERILSLLSEMMRRDETINIALMSLAKIEIESGKLESALSLLNRISVPHNQLISKLMIEVLMKLNNWLDLRRYLEGRRSLSISRDQRAGLTDVVNYKIAERSYSEASSDQLLGAISKELMKNQFYPAIYLNILIKIRMKLYEDASSLIMKSWGSHSGILFGCMLMLLQSLPDDKMTKMISKITKQNPDAVYNVILLIIDKIQKRDIASIYQLLDVLQGSSYVHYRDIIEIYLKSECNNDIRKLISLLLNGLHVVSYYWDLNAMVYKIQDDGCVIKICRTPSFDVGASGRT